MSSNKLFSLNKQQIYHKRWMLNYRNPIIFFGETYNLCLDTLGLHKECRGRTHQIQVDSEDKQIKQNAMQIYIDTPNTANV